MRRWWLRLRLRFIEIAYHDAESVLNEIDAIRPIAQARLCKLQDEHNALLREIYPPRSMDDCRMTDYL